MNDVKKVIAYTKGSGENMDGKYGWGYTLEYPASGNNEQTDSFRTEMNAVLSALKSMDKSVSVEIRTNNEAIAKICEGSYKADKSKDLYNEYKEQEELFIKAGGSVTFKYISITERDKHFEELRKVARDEVTQ